LRKIILLKKILAEYAKNKKNAKNSLLKLINQKNAQN